jgi:heme/copper-type cytochrome/quinol oxidase subunit 4
VEDKDLPRWLARVLGSRHLLLGNVSKVIRAVEPPAGLKSYVTGALLALVLTLSPLPWLWAERAARTQSAICGLTVIQIIVHLEFFWAARQIKAGTSRLSLFTP